jgi:hypothetical protein
MLDGWCVFRRLVDTSNGRHHHRQRAGSALARSTCDGGRTRSEHHAQPLRRSHGIRPEDRRARTAARDLVGAQHGLERMDVSPEGRRAVDGWCADHGRRFRLLVEARRRSGTGLPLCESALLREERGGDRGGKGARHNEARSPRDRSRYVRGHARETDRVLHRDDPTLRICRGPATCDREAPRNRVASAGKPCVERTLQAGGASPV